MRNMNEIARMWEQELLNSVLNQSSFDIMVNGKQLQSMAGFCQYKQNGIIEWRKSYTTYNYNNLEIFRGIPNRHHRKRIPMIGKLEKAGLLMFQEGEEY